MSAGHANKGRWALGSPRRRATAIEDEYEAILSRLEATGASFAPLLRRTFERSQSADPASLPPLPYPGVEVEKVAAA